MHIKSSWILTALWCAFDISKAYAASESPERFRVGVLFSSYGDIDDPNEAQDYVIKTLSDPDLIPLPTVLRLKLAHLGWALRQPQIIESYRSIGWKTNYRATTQKQADIVAAKLHQVGLDARGYAGFLFTFPFISEALDKARRDGVTYLIVINQGAQYSLITTGLEFRDTQNYLNAHPEWNVRATGIKQYARDPRFLHLLHASIQKRINTSFANVSPEDLCIFLPMHGSLMKWVEEGDPYYQEVLEDVESVKVHFPGHLVSHGFLNRDEMPLFTWTQPKDTVALGDLVRRGCQNILINGRISFTVDSIETLHDQAIAERQAITAVANEIGFRAPRVTVEPMFNLEDNFLTFQAQLVREALNGQGDLEVLR